MKEKDMLVSHAFPFSWRAAPATLYLLRNNGYAWGRIVDVSGTNLDVMPDGDVYDMDDTDALELLAELAVNHPSMVTEAEGWEFDHA